MPSGQLQLHFPTDVISSQPGTFCVVTRAAISPFFYSRQLNCWTAVVGGRITLLRSKQRWGASYLTYQPIRKQEWKTNFGLPSVLHTPSLQKSILSFGVIKSPPSRNPTHTIERGGGIWAFKQCLRKTSPRMRFLPIIASTFAM